MSLKWMLAGTSSSVFALRNCQNYTIELRFIYFFIHDDPRLSSAIPFQSSMRFNSCQFGSLDNRSSSLQCCLFSSELEILSATIQTKVLKHCFHVALLGLIFSFHFSIFTLRNFVIYNVQEDWGEVCGGQRSIAFQLTTAYMN